MPLGYRRMSTTLSGRHSHHKDGVNQFVGAGTVVVVVDDVDVVELVDEVLDDEVVLDGFTVDDVDELVLLVALVDDVDPIFVPSSVG